MKEQLFLLFFLFMLIVGCEKADILSPEDFEINEANWDPEIEIDCEKCDKPICHWNIAWELRYIFDPKNGKEKAVCWYYINDKVKIEPIFEKNKMIIGSEKLSDPNLLLDCWEDHEVGLCCAYTVEELLSDKYVCKDVFLEALCRK